MSNAFYCCNVCWNQWLENLDKCPNCGTHNFYLDTEIIPKDDKENDADEISEDDGDEVQYDARQTLQLNSQKRK